VVEIFHNQKNQNPQQQLQDCLKQKRLIKVELYSG